MNTVTTPTQAFATCAYKEVREKQASAFTKYLDSRPCESGYVANLNGAWGTGKTFFVDNWVQWLRENGYVAIKIDAWESDYLNDPLALVTAEMLSQLRDRGGIADFAEQEKQIINFGWKLAKNFLPVLTMALGRHFLGKDYEELLKEVGIGVKDASNDGVESTTDFGAFGQEIFNTHDKHKEFVYGFKTHLSDLVKVVREHSKHNKVYVFIDELDRCRPTYAIEMLEVVKHLFDIPNLVFVLSTDTNQLECSIKAVYGETFNSEEYLSRFFKRRLTLSKPDYLTFVRSQKIFSQFEFDQNLIFPRVCNDTAQEIFAIICQINKLSFRRTEQVSARVESALLSLSNTTVVSFIELVCNVVLYEIYPKESFNYKVAYTPNVNFKYNGVVKPKIGLNNSNVLFDLYQRIWDDMVLMQETDGKDAHVRMNVNNQMANRINTLVDDVHKIQNKGSIESLINRHFKRGNNNTGYYTELNATIQNEKLKLLHGNELNNQLHIFDSIS